ncbi:MAG: F0F1 ATP synthase subunit B [Synechococcaceae cyanobacterium]|nr:F0F1 ATP synthase subunit B [Synechococcaceae cyanobacterium]
MLIDWFIVAAQILNFLILVAFLRWLLYRPVLRLIRERREHIARQWSEARAEREQAEAERARQEELRRGLEETRRQWLEEARSAAAGERQRRLAQARAEVDELRRHWREELRQERSAFLESLRSRVVCHTEAVARRALADLAGEGLESRIVHTFLERLRQPEERRLREIAASRGEGRRLQVRTAFDLSPELRRDLLEQLGRRLPGLAAEELEFTRDPALLCGIELRLAGQSIGWNLDQYLTGLERQMAAALDGTTHHAQPVG